MPEVSWTSDTRMGGVSGLVDLFRTTFVFGINSSGYFYSTGQFIGQTVQGGWFDVRCVRGGVDIRIAYSYPWYISDQLSCRKYFDSSYGLKDINYQSFNH